MERGSITRWLLFGLAIFLLLTFGKKAIFGSKASDGQPWGGVSDAQEQTGGPPEQMCSLDGSRFVAELSTHGASLRHVRLKDYTAPVRMPSDLLGSIKHLLVGDNRASSDPADMVSNTREELMPLRTDLHEPTVDAAKQQVRFDDLDWQLDKDASTGGKCVFTYKDETTSLRKTVSLTGKPFEMAVELEVENLGPSPKTHRFEIEQDAWRTKQDMDSHLGRQSELLTEAVNVAGKKTVRHGPGDFDPDKFKDPEFTGEKWRRTPGEGELAAVSSVYFSNLVVPIDAKVPSASVPPTPVAETQIQEIWTKERFPNKENDPQFGYAFRARIAYPEVELAPGQKATYHALAYMGPKERHLLAAVDHGAPEVLNLGTFVPIARVLVSYLHWLHGLIGSWGWAIVLLTITVRLVLFPLSLSQIKNSVAMRRLKPEMDAINEKYKDDTAQRGLAIRELWRKNNVSPMIGCLPMVIQLPVWWALYTALQTAVELYHVPFGPVIPDLTAPGKYLIIPLVLAGSSFLQQKMMPAQGDPQQQKMMLYMIPGIFTFMMLFLPAGLGVYMVTNSVLAIGQQVLVERYLKRTAGQGPGIEVREKPSGGGGKPAPALGKGKARARG
jgi:YidC/Oxa1 family membrane protein insertase